MTTFLQRLQHAWAVLTGKIILPSQIEGMILMNELTKTAAAISDLSASADRLLAKNGDDAAALAAAQATIADADDTTSQAVAAVTAKIDAVVPAPVAVVSGWVDPNAPAV